MTVKWIYNDESSTLGHVSKLILNGKETLSPQHALSIPDIEAIGAFKLKSINDNIVVGGESLDYSTFQSIGKQATTTDSLIKRFKNKTLPGRINFIYGRIPSEYNVNGNILPVLDVDDLQASAIVGAQLEADASALIPPIPNGIQSRKVFNRIFNRTKIENQTFKKEKEIIGLIPKTEHIDIIPDMVKEYIKFDVRIFAIDFSGSYLPRALIRQTVRAIRTNLKIKKDKEPEEKHYYLHIFDAATSVRSSTKVTSMTDILTHAYGVDSTSGVMWGGGKLDRNKLRYFNMKDYGAYKIADATNYHITIPFQVPDSAISAYKTLRAHRMVDYYNECKSEISTSISNGNPKKSYATYLNSKTRASEQVTKIFSDIKEIKTNV